MNGPDQQPPDQQAPPADPPADPPAGPPADTPTDTAAQADVGPSAAVSLRSQFKAAVAPVEQRLDELETAQHQEGQAVQVEDTARRALEEAAGAREAKTEDTLAMKATVSDSLADLDSFLQSLRGELST